MSIVVRFKPTSSERPSSTTRSIRRLKDAGDFSAGLAAPCHVVFRHRGESAGQRDLGLARERKAFGDRLMPILNDVGISFASEPEIYEAHNLVTR